jgi:hypothetical protein
MSLIEMFPMLDSAVVQILLGVVLAICILYNRRDRNLGNKAVCIATFAVITSLNSLFVATGAIGVVFLAFVVVSYGFEGTATAARS